MSNIPKELKYTSSHEWVKEDNGIITVGITDHAQSLLGDVVYVELPEQDKAVKANEGCAVIESVKAAADVYAPLACEILETNQALSTNPELINVDPYGDGWLFRAKISNAQDSQALLGADQYKQAIEQE